MSDHKNEDEKIHWTWQWGSQRAFKREHMSEEMEKQEQNILKGWVGPLKFGKLEPLPKSNFFNIFTRVLITEKKTDSNGLIERFSDAI